MSKGADAECVPPATDTTIASDTTTIADNPMMAIIVAFFTIYGNIKSYFRR